MTYAPNEDGMVSIEDARRILRAIFPNYPELKPCYPAPTLEPDMKVGAAEVGAQSPA